MLKTMALIGLVPPRLFAVRGSRPAGHIRVLRQRRAGAYIPTQSLTPFDRAWNEDNQSKYEAENSAEWLGKHGKRLFPFF
jgi:hypothetical protein